MKLLLTDSGIRNASMLAALVDLLGKPIAEASALCIPTAGYGGPDGDPEGPWRFISGRSPNPMTELGWKSVGARAGHRWTDLRFCMVGRTGFEPVTSSVSGNSGVS